MRAVRVLAVAVLAGCAVILAGRALDREARERDRVQAERCAASVAPLAGCPQR